MAKVVEIEGRKYWADFKGDLTAAENISKEDKARDRVAETVCTKAIKISEKLAEFKNEVSGIIDEYLAGVADKFKTTWKGNTQIVNFSQDLRVQVRIQESMDFDEKLNVAKNLIDECLLAWTSDSNPALATLVNKAFETDRKGKINREFVLKLIHLKMNAKTHMDKWNEAIQILEKSMFVKSSKRQLTFQKRGENGEWETILLDFAAL